LQEDTEQNELGSCTDSPFYVHVAKRSRDAITLRNVSQFSHLASDCHILQIMP